VDGITLGSTPEEVFINRGAHRVELVLPGFKGAALELEVPGRRVFSLFIPRRLTVQETLTSPDALGVVTAAAADYTAWSFTGEATSAYQIPLSLSEGVYRGGPSLEGAQREEAAELIRAAARVTMSQASLRDLGRAKLLLDNGGLAPSPVSLSRSASDIMSWLSASPQAGIWLAGLLPPEAAAQVRNSPWGQAREEPPAQVERLDRDRTAPLEIEGLRFYPVSTGTAGEEVLYYSEAPVNSTVWGSFVQARPRWAITNLEGLREQGLVNGDYLITAGDSAARREDPQTGISWYAAAAFCQWLGGGLPPGFEGWEVRLPRETEWEYAAPLLAGAAPANSGGPSNRVGLWEWCADPYAPIRLFPAGEGAVEALSSPERSLRGAHRPDSRGSLPPGFCSPYVGLRPFIARQGGTP
jgi:hypothetical protein